MHPDVLDVIQVCYYKCDTLTIVCDNSEVGHELVLLSNRKSHIGFQLVLKLVA